MLAYALRYDLIRQLAEITLDAAAGLPAVQNLLLSDDMETPPGQIRNSTPCYESKQNSTQSREIDSDRQRTRRRPPPHPCIGDDAHRQSAELADYRGDIDCRSNGGNGDMGDGGALMDTLNELMHAVGLVGYAVIVALAL